MKAKQYYQRYGAALCDISHPERQQIALGNLIKDFENEQERESIKWRKCNRAIPNIVRDYNNKWNAISRMVQEACGKEILMKDGWSLYMGEVINL